jgi:predicted Zn-dependent protease
VSLKTSPNELFESSKLFRSDVSVSADMKLTSTQKTSIACNGAILSMMLKKHSAAREAAKKILQVYPNNPKAATLLAGIDAKENKLEKALKDLKVYYSFGSNHPVPNKKIPDFLRNQSKVAHRIFGLASIKRVP